MGIKSESIEDARLVGKLKITLTFYKKNKFNTIVIIILYKTHKNTLKYRYKNQ